MASNSNGQKASDSIRPRFRRRRYLVDRRRQLRETLRIVALVAVLLAMLVATVWYQNTTETETVSVEHPQLAEQMRAEDIKNLLMMIAISLIILGMVVIRSVMITHRTAGAVINISDKLEKIANGDYTATLRLRENDNIRALEDPFNKMVEALRRRAEDDHRSLTKLAKDIEENGNPVDAEMLRRIADAHGQLIEEG